MSRLAPPYGALVRPHRSGACVLTVLTSDTGQEWYFARSVAPDDIDAALLETPYRRVSLVAQVGRTALFTVEPREEVA